MLRRSTKNFSPARAVTPSSAEDDRMSESSKKSTLSSRGYRKAGGSEHPSVLSNSIRLRPGKWLKPREYMLLLVEASLSMAVFVVTTRNTSKEETRMNNTSRKVQIYLLYAEGYSSLLSMFIGFIADSWLRHSTVALFSVILHFAAVCAVLMEDVVERSQQHNPYRNLVWNVCVAALVLIQATDFTRLVYGLEGMTNRKTSTIYIFIFLQFWVSSYATLGGVFVNVGSALFTYFGLDQVIAAFVMSGLSLFLFFYHLDPETETKENRGLGCQVIGCISLATFYKAFRIKKHRRRGFFGNTEGTFKRTTIYRTKELLLMYVLLLPTFGIVFNQTLRSKVFYKNILERINPEKFVEAVGLEQLARAFLSIAMLISYFVLWPILTLIGVKDKLSIKFLVGHFVAVLGLFYAAFLMKEIEPTSYPTGSGFVRIFNTRENTVRFISEDREFTLRNFDVHPKKAEMVAYPSSRPALTPVRVEFNGTNNSFVTFLAVERYNTIGYMVLEPPEVVRIRGPYLPVREGPPGTNRRGCPKIFIYNTAKTLDCSTITIKYAHKRKTIREVNTQPGVMTTICLTPGLYDFTILRGDVRKIVKIEQGAVYGMMIYSTTTSRGMAIDTVIGPNTASAWPYLGMYIVIGLSNGICSPSLRAMTFTIAPHGLLAMSFAFLSFLEGFSLWAAYIGFNTWHTDVVSDTLLVYASCLTIFLVINSFIMLKYNDRYNT